MPSEVESEAPGKTKCRAESCWVPPAAAVTLSLHLQHQHSHRLLLPFILLPYQEVYQLLRDSCGLICILFVFKQQLFAGWILVHRDKI